MKTMVCDKWMDTHSHVRAHSVEWENGLRHLQPSVNVTLQLLSDFTMVTLKRQHIITLKLLWMQNHKVNIVTFNNYQMKHF